MRVSILDVLVNVPDVHPSHDGGRTARATQRAEIISGNGNSRKARVSGVEREHQVCRWILNYVESDIPEVPLVGDAVAATYRCLAITLNVPGKTKARREVVLVGSPEATNRTAGRHLIVARLDLLERVARSVIEIRILALIFVVLYAVVFIAQAQIQSNPRTHAPGVVERERP